jgi:hypothetical protein
MSWDEDDPPDTDRILAQTVALFAQRGDEQAVALLIDVQSVEFGTTDEEAHREYDGRYYMTYYHRTAVLDVDDHLVPRFTAEVQDRVLETLSYVAERSEVPHVKYIKVRPTLPQVDENWRETYAARLDADQPTNQARRERGIAQYPAEDGLTFGSAEELRVYRALRHLQARMPEDDTFAIVPLPGARLRAGHTWSPDFIVTGRGRAVVIEVDGPHHRTVLRRADDGNRDLQWRRCGIPVVRLPVEDLKDEQELDARLTEELRRHLPRSPG